MGDYRWDHTAAAVAVELLYIFVGRCMHSSQLQGETTQLGNTKQRHTYMMNVAQLQQHISGGDAGGPEEAPLVEPAALP